MSYTLYRKKTLDKEISVMNKEYVLGLNKPSPYTQAYSVSRAFFFGGRVSALFREMAEDMFLEFQRNQDMPYEKLKEYLKGVIELDDKIHNVWYTIMGVEGVKK